MPCYAGLDVSLATTAVCIVETSGEILAEEEVASDVKAVAAVLRPFRRRLKVGGVEATELGMWLQRGLEKARFPVVPIEIGHCHGYLKTRRNKTDRNDARGIAEVMLSGLYRPVHSKSASSRETRALLTARSLLRIKAADVEITLRAILRAHGYKLGPRISKRLASEVRQATRRNLALRPAVEGLLGARESLRREFEKLDTLVKEMAVADPVCRRMMTVPGVGPIIALTFKCAIDDPHRFERSRDVAAHLGLTPRVYQSGESIWLGRITKRGDCSVRTALYQAACALMHPKTRMNPLKEWCAQLMVRRGGRRARVALARRLAVILHRMWVDETDFQPERLIPGSVRKLAFLNGPTNPFEFVGQRNAVGDGAGPVEGRDAARGA